MSFVSGFTLGVVIASVLAVLVVRALLALHEKEIERIKVTYQQAIRMALTGSPTQVAAVVEDREPDAHERLSRDVAEQTILTGMASMKAQYKALGVELDDDTLRAEVEQILLAGSVTTPFSGMVKARGGS